MGKINLSEATIRDIDSRMDRILNEIGNPEPPINHKLISEALKLDLNYFQKDNPSVVEELISRFKRGVKQIKMRPSIILDVINSGDLRAAYIPDSKRIYVDNSLHDLKKDGVKHMNVCITFFRGIKILC